MVQKTIYYWHLSLPLLRFLLPLAASQTSDSSPILYFLFGRELTPKCTCAENCDKLCSDECCPPVCVLVSWSPEPYDTSQKTQFAWCHPIPWVIWAQFFPQRLDRSASIRLANYSIPLSSVCGFGKPPVHQRPAFGHFSWGSKAHIQQFHAKHGVPNDTRWDVFSYRVRANSYFSWNHPSCLPVGKNTRRKHSLFNTELFPISKKVWSAQSNKNHTAVGPAVLNPLLFLWYHEYHST